MNERYCPLEAIGVVSQTALETDYFASGPVVFRRASYEYRKFGTPLEVPKITDVVESLQNAGYSGLIHAYSAPLGGEEDKPELMSSIINVRWVDSDIPKEPQKGPYTRLPAIEAPCIHAILDFNEQVPDPEGLVGKLLSDSIAVDYFSPPNKVGISIGASDKNPSTDMGFWIGRQPGFTPIEWDGTVIIAYIRGDEDQREQKIYAESFDAFLKTLFSA